MKKYYYFLLYSLSLFIFDLSFGQTGTWTWISGSKTVNASAVYGTKGTGATTNQPPAIYDPLEWKDKSGNFWLYGGTIPLNTDMWKFDPTTLKWTWMNGNGSVNQAISYGTKGVAAASNTPGQRSYTAPTWVDTSGALWLMGGDGQYDDMWKYNTGTNLWTWMSGTSTNQYSVHGTQGVASSSNTPGNRDGTASAWTDASNNLWLFGGFGYEDDGAAGGMEDVWEYKISTDQWTWVKGSQYINNAPVYGTEGVEASGNTPGGRFTYSKWTDASGNFWIMGGLDWENFGLRNDVWKYNVSTNNWTWMSGTSTLDDAGTYTSTCNYNKTDIPDSRWFSKSAVTDHTKQFWQFGGFGNDSNLNELWVFDATYLKWNIVKGPRRDKASSYGTKGTASAANMPPARGGAVAWWGNNKRFYMFGGEADNSNQYGDIWMFNPDTVGCVLFANRSAALPIDLINFDAIYDGKAVALTWSTASEINNDFFTVERSKDGVDFTFVLKTNGAGTSNSVTNYDGVDDHPLSGISYYRLKQTDFDGHYSYSNLVPVKILNENTDFILFPNPAGNMLTIYGLKFTAATATIQNVIGEVCLQSEIKNTEHTLGQSEIDVSILPAGIYFLQLNTASGSIVKKFVKE